METITDLHGNTYKLGDFQLSLEFPKLLNYEIRAFTKNVKEGTPMNIISDGKHTFMVKYLMYCNLYVVYKLKFVSYNRKMDIRKSYEHGNKYHA